jgi:hypothetical protein
MAGLSKIDERAKLPDRAKPLSVSQPMGLRIDQERTKVND